MAQPNDWLDADELAAVNCETFRGYDDLSELLAHLSTVVAEQTRAGNRILSVVTVFVPHQLNRPRDGAWTAQVIHTTPSG